MSTPRAKAKRSHHREEPDPVARAVGQRIKKLRLAQGWTFDAFVEEVQLGRGYVSELERGLIAATVIALDRIAQALELTPADLVVGDSPREQLFEVARDLSPAAVQRLLAEARRVAAREAEKK